MFDTICKFLIETFSTDFASWLLGEPIALTELSPSELSLEPIRADALILMQSDSLLLHVEFQTQPDPEIPFRMLDYRVRGYRRFPRKAMRQVVIYLKQTGSELVRQTTFTLPSTRHEFEVIRLWEQPLEVFLNTPGLLPFAVLSRVADRSEALRQAAIQLEAIPDRRMQSNVTAAAAILAGLVLERGMIQQILRREIMQESVIYQDILQEGRQEGRQEEGRSFVLRLLTRKFGEVPPDLGAQIERLSLAQLEELGEALLDFSTLQELSGWLDNNL
ncbi:MAG: Rpn family recombination-promoting nuclease/putative transposase [Leptolyngbyaceae cyanobacterium MO_188.B28]|nr:Rpn family recombination-promoting nuclease/putative transposase [Leptolyngbyaceae cyanobacterium MO_188.B28]